MAKLFYALVLITLIITSAIANPPIVSNRKWILERIRDTQTKKEIYLDEEHYLFLSNGGVSFKIDCNACSGTYEFIAKDSIMFGNFHICTRMACLEKDKYTIAYSGAYKIWMEGSYFVIETEQGDHIYK